MWVDRLLNNENSCYAISLRGVHLFAFIDPSIYIRKFYLKSAAISVWKLEHNLFKNVQKDQHFCDKHYFEWLDMASLMQ